MPPQGARPAAYTLLTEQTQRFLNTLGGISVLAGQTIAGSFHRRLAVKELIYQIEAIGNRSIAIAVLTAIFSSMVMTVQFSVQMSRFGVKEYVSSVVSLSLVRELGPVLTALLVGGRVSAGIAAELGSMRVTEQLDAIRAIGADPIQKLVVPRVLATTLVLPLLAILADVLGVLGAMVIARVDSDVGMTLFLESTVRSVELGDFFHGLGKTVFFGFLLGLIACYKGLHTSGGTEGVGRCTTETVVITSLVTLCADFVLTNLLLGFGL
jgi:phospholipid/cholesterol/gamma-HCH transport system permease protein